MISLCSARSRWTESSYSLSAAEFLGPTELDSDRVAITIRISTLVLLSVDNIPELTLEQRQAAVTDLQLHLLHHPMLQVGTGDVPVCPRHLLDLVVHINPERTPLMSPG